MLSLKHNIIVTAALPYANADLHIGHLRSTYIPADIYARFLRLKGHRVIYICATDEHGTPIAIRAEREKINPQKIADRYHKSIRQDLMEIGCSFDNFGRTTSKTHYHLTQKFFKQLLHKGYIYRNEFQQLFCPQCQRYLADRFVEGRCSYCGGEKARGDACDACGRYLKPDELEKPYCIFCGTEPETRDTEHWFLKLEFFQDFLEDWIDGNAELSPNVKNYASEWLNEGLREWCITRDMEWGVPVPVKDVEEKVIYVWFDAPIGYISSSIEWANLGGEIDAWRDFWQKKNGRIVHFIGKDIIYHHAIFWPAMLKGYNGYGLPYKIIAGEYLTLEGKKMSKSREWVIGVRDYLEKHDADPLRYYLIAVSPLSKDADFSWKEFNRKNNDELADILGNFIHRTLTFTYRYFDKRVPNPGKLDKEDEEVIKAIEGVKQEVEDLLVEQKFHRAIRAIMTLASRGNRYLNEKEPWVTLRDDPQEARTTLYVSNQINKALSLLLEPFLPFTAEKIWDLLNLPESVHAQDWDEVLEPLSPGLKIKEPYPLFKKIEESG